MKGEKLKELRKSHGYTRKELAECIGETEYTIQAWEQGWYIYLPTSGQMERMAELFELSEEDLRIQIDQDEDDDHERGDVTSMDYLDAFIRWGGYLKKISKNKK